MGEHAVDVVGAPAVVGIVHHHFFDDGIGEMVQRVFGEKGHVGPVGVPAGTQVAGVLLVAWPPGGVPHGGQRGIAPVALIALIGLGDAGIRTGGRRHRDRADVVDKGHARPRLDAGQPAQPLLHFLDDFCAFGAAQHFRAGVARHQHDAHRHRTDQVAAGGRAGRFGRGFGCTGCARRGFKRAEFTRRLIARRVPAQAFGRRSCLAGAGASGLHAVVPRINGQLRGLVERLGRLRC